MKKVGIITHYYKNHNYGGVLQAYALCKKLNSLGYAAEQIQYKHRVANSDGSQTSKFNIKKIIKGIKFRLRKANRDFLLNKTLRYKAFERFEDETPHSADVYFDNTIGQCGDSYDVFVTGSDQVWNMKWFDDAYFLGFVKNKPKFSYAASIGASELSDEERSFFKARLSDYAGISVRESDSVKLLEPLLDRKVVCTLDPTLLLSTDEWDEIAARRKTEEKYVFCYFIGSTSAGRKLAAEYAQNHNLKLVTMPYLWGEKRKCDDNFGDVRLFDVTPPEFISLIKFAECVFTDSFHASVFSCIYDKPFFVVPRAEFKKMSNRIVSLTEIFGNADRFCNNEEKQSLGYVNSVEFKKYNRDILKKEKEKSEEFLKQIALS